MFTATTYSRLLSLLFVVICIAAVSIATPGSYDTRRGEQHPLAPIADNRSAAVDPDPAVAELLDALDVLEVEYFALWPGTWPNAIDWTSAVIGTFLAASLSTLSAAYESVSSSKRVENTINKYFSQLVASYFGQNAFALRQEAYDDMLWVVLGWLEGIKFISAHSATHYSTEGEEGEWHGTQFIPAFAHRARIFWELASQGWDTSLCNGGMIWSPYLTPYKNAITNELYISASISMYLYFPGDSNRSPFGFSNPEIYSSALKAAMETGSPPHDPKYLAAAIEAYKWLMTSNMTDSQGLFVDGYHVSGWKRDRYLAPSERKCDERNEMVYTYNQGVLLTGQRGLYEATGSRTYLEDGHRLVSDVIAATGWDLEHDKVFNEALQPTSFQLGRWYGLGRSGILEEACDAGAYCSQDSQTFKGIFFHHLTTFCQQLPDDLNPHARRLVVDESVSQEEEARQWHSERCGRYQGWIRQNAQAALKTRDGKGRFGMWWGAPENRASMPDIVEVVIPDDAVDYRNEGVPGEWKEQSRIARRLRTGDAETQKNDLRAQDLNDRGRGRTVETQGGGLSLLRALWELVDTKS